MIIQESSIELNSMMTFASASISNNFLVMIGDEHFYHFIGKQGGIIFSEYLHPDYLEEFETLCKSLNAEQSARMIALLRDFKEDYHLVDILISNNGQILAGTPVLNLRLFNINAIEKRHIRSINELNKYRSFLSMYKDYLFDYDTETGMFSIFLYMGSKSTPFIKCDIEEFQQLASISIKDAEARKEFEIFYNHIIAAREDFTCSVQLPLNKDADTYDFFRVNGKVIYKQNKKPVVIGIIRPESGDSRNLIPYYATNEAKDPATGLLNKRACHEYTNDILMQNDGNKHYMVIIDADNFKEINDNYGHLFGDEVIQKIAHIINSTLNSRGVCGRFGGDEFFLFTTNIKTEMQLRDLLTAMRKELYYAYENVMENFHITLSIGVSLYPDDGRTYDELFKKADKCLYLAKNRGRDRFVIYNEAKHGGIEDNTKVLRYTFNPLEKAEYLAGCVGEICNTLLTNGRDSLNEILARICSDFEIDGIRIYGGPDATLLHSAGTYKKMPVTDSYLTDESFLDLYNKNHVIICNHVSTFEANHKEYTHSLTDCNIMSAASYYFKAADGSNIFFFYDIFNHSNRWHESDKNYLLTLSKVISAIL